MKRTTFALVLSLIVSVPAIAQTAQPAAPAREKTIVDLVKDEIAKGNYREAEALARRDMRAIGRTPLAIEAFSWLGRGTLAAKQYDVAMTYAARAYEMGLVNAVVPRDELLDTAFAFARRITANAPLAVQATKASALAGLYVDDAIVRNTRRALRHVVDALATVTELLPADAAADAKLTLADAEQAVKELRTAFEQESAYSNTVFRSDDAKEGPRAFAEKRPPVWQGH